MNAFKLFTSSLLFGVLIFQATAQQHPGFSKLFEYSGDELNRGHGIPNVIYDYPTDYLFFPLTSFNQFGDMSAEFFKCDIEGNIIKQKVDTIANMTIRYYDLKELNGYIYWVGTIYPKHPIPDSANSKPMITKTDKELNIIWRKELPNLEREGEINRIAVDKKKHEISLVVSKKTIYQNSYYTETYPYSELTKIDTTGSIIWSKVFGDQYYDYGMAMILDKNGEHMIAGSTYGWNANSSGGNPFLFKANQEGDELWHQIYEINKPSATLLSLIETNEIDKSYASAGQSTDYNMSKSYDYVSKYDTEGFEIWNKKIKINNLDVSLWDIANTKDLGLLSCGALDVDNPNIFGRTGLIVKLDQDGNELWRRRVASNAPDANHHGYLFSMIEIPDGSFIASGQSVGEDYIQYGWLVRVDSLGCTEPGCVPTSINETPLAASNFKIYPNPTSDYFEIESASISFKGLEVSILDINGRRLKRLAPSMEKINRFNVQQFPSGIYMIELKQKDQLAYLKLNIK